MGCKGLKNNYPSFSIADINECAKSESNDCNTNTSCNNTCVCLRGYQGDGKNCTGIRIFIAWIYTVQLVFACFFVTWFYFCVFLNHQVPHSHTASDIIELPECTYNQDQKHTTSLMDNINFVKFLSNISFFCKFLL